MKTALFAICLALFATAAFARVESHHLESNRTPKKSVQFTSVCDECQTVIRRFKDVAKDPAKLAELKALLSVLCHETSYEEECRVFVSKLDLFIDRLLPYLQDPEAVCKKLHMCANSRLDQFHRVGIIYAKKYLNQVDGASDLICEECQFAAHELQGFIDDKQTQGEIRTFISKSICARLGQYRGSCDLLVEDFLPELFVELHNLLANQHLFCEDLKLCKPAQTDAISDETAPKSAHRHGYPALERLGESLRSLTIEQNHVNAPLQLSMSCFECRIMVDALLDELRSNSSVYSLAADLRDGVCPRLPQNFLFGCNDFVNMYGPTVVSMTLQQFGSEQVCTSMHCCTKNSFMQTRKVPYEQLTELKCDSCKGISELLQLELSKPSFRADVIYDVDHYLCETVPASLFYMCDNLTKGFVPLAITKLLQKLQDNELCYALRACTK